MINQAKIQFQLNSETLLIDRRDISFSICFESFKSQELLSEISAVSGPLLGKITLFQ
jgi:hypothetical protein